MKCIYNLHTVILMVAFHRSVNTAAFGHVCGVNDAGSYFVVNYVFNGIAQDHSNPYESRQLREKWRRGVETERYRPQGLPVL